MACFLLLIGSVAALACLERIPLVQRDARSHLQAVPNKRVVLSPARETEHARELRFAGIVQAVKRARLSVTVRERVTRRPVDVGDQVKEGDVLFRLDDRRLRNKLDAEQAILKEIQARIEQIERDRERFEGLVEANASARIKLEKVMETEKVLQASRLAAQAKVREAERLLEETTLKAPFDATVAEVALEPGELAGPGRPVIVLSGTDGTEIRVEVPESVISELRVGTPVTIDLPLAGRKGIGGTIRCMGRSALGPGRLFPVFISPAHEAHFVPGMAAEVVFTMPERKALCVPLSSVVDPGGNAPSVFSVQDGKACLVGIEVRHVVGDRVVVEGPLHEGSLVVSGGHLTLLDGDRIEGTIHEHR
jgi:RND family efflux transporter MFP subunit